MYVCIYTYKLLHGEMEGGLFSQLVTFHFVLGTQVGKRANIHFDRESGYIYTMSDAVKCRVVREHSIFNLTPYWMSDPVRCRIARAIFVCLSNKHTATYHLFSQ